MKTETKVVDNDIRNKQNIIELDLSNRIPDFLSTTNNLVFLKTNLANLPNLT